MIQAVLAIARLTRKRMLRGRTIWITGLLLLVPIVLALVTLGRVEQAGERWAVVCELTFRSLVLLAPVLHLAPALGEENEGKTYTYLWSRPVPRTALILGKMVAVVPILIVVACGALAAAFTIVSLGAGEAPVEWAVRAIGAAAAGVFAASCFAVGLGSLLPRYPLLITVGYVFIAEQIFAEIKAVQNISTLYHVQTIARVPSTPYFSRGGSPAEALLALALLSAFWLGLGLWRVRRFEFGSADS